MQQILNEVLDKCPEAYANWPCYMKKMFWCVAEHYMHHDEKKFTEICMILEQWCREDEVRAYAESQANRPDSETIEIKTIQP